MRYAEPAARPQGEDEAWRLTTHEEFLRLAGHPVVRWQNRRHFYAAAARAMRRLLVDRARRRKAGKRGGGAVAVSLEAVAEPTARLDEDVVGLDESLRRLAALDPLKAWIVELRFFGGFSIDDTAEIVGLSRASVVRQWRIARAWLYRSLSRDPPGAGRGGGGEHGS
ncbi:MAG TPA: ECF-type sigma factor [Thermoanaerobaculia bacterium]